VIDTASVRAQFPALRREVAGSQAVYLDGPGGTQVPRSVIDAMAGVLERGVSNLSPRFDAGVLAIQTTADARAAVADFFGAASPNEIVFGQNMTSLTFAVSRALANTWQPGDEIIVTALDHDANRTPWVMAAEDRGVSVKVVPFDTTIFDIHLASIRRALTDRTRLIAVTHASNAVGTIVDVGAVTELAHSVGALSYVDAVHFAPHGPIDVQQIDCDFLVASAYKFFGPHTGCLFGKAQHLQSLTAYKVRPAPADGPGKWETGTQSFESLAGVTAAVDYLAGLGEGPDRRSQLVSAMQRIREYEMALSRRFLDGIEDMEHITLYGIPDVADRAPTFAIDVDGVSASAVASRLGERGVFVWDGHYYAVGVMEALGRIDSGGLVRIGFTHYTTPDEIDRLLTELRTFG